MQSVANCAIELGCVRGVEHDTEIVAVGPVALPAELLLHTLVEHGSRQWIRERDPDVVWARAAHEVYGLLQLSPGLSRIAQLQEITGADFRFQQPVASGDDG